MRLRSMVLLSAATAAVMTLAPGVALAQSAVPPTCTGTPQRCDVTFENEAGKLFLGNNGGKMIVFPGDSGNGQRWDVYLVPSDGYYAIYNHRSNNVVGRGGGCTSNGGTYKYCAVIQGAGSSLPLSQQWIELRTDPMVFENADSGGRCLDDPGGNAAAGSQVVLYPCSTTDPAQQWAGS
jgi:hypothetical protein